MSGVWNPTPITPFTIITSPVRGKACLVMLVITQPKGSGGPYATLPAELVDLVLGRTLRETAFDVPLCDLDGIVEVGDGSGRYVRLRVGALLLA